MMRMAVFCSFTVLATYSSPQNLNTIQNDFNLAEYPPLCTVTIANETKECKLRFNYDCCAEEGTLTPYIYQRINDTAVTFTLLNNKTDHMFYLTKGCNTNYTFCVTILIFIPEHNLKELRAKRLEATAKISKLRSELKYGLFLATTQNNRSRRADCYDLTNTSMNQYVRSDKLILTKIRSSYLEDPLDTSLVESSCNYSCSEGRPQHCKWQIVEVKQWAQVTEKLVFNATLIHGTYYCVLVTHTKLPNCAIALVTFQHKASQGLPLSEGNITNENVDAIISIILLLLTLCFFCVAILFWSFLHRRGYSFSCCLTSASSMSVECPSSLLEDSAEPVRRHDAISKKQPPARRIFLLYSRDSKELCDCMMALGKVLSLSTQAEILDPLNNLWGKSEESKRLLAHREGGLSKWLYAHLERNCSILLLMSPGGKIREKALDRLERVVFDPPNVLDDIFLLGLDYIRVQKANDYANVFQISFKSVGDAGETYNVGVRLAKYILPLRLQQLISTLRRDNRRTVPNGLTQELAYAHTCKGCTRALKKFDKALRNLQTLHMKDPQYMNRTIVSLDMHSTFTKSPKLNYEKESSVERSQD